MTTSGQAEEVPFLSGFERQDEPPKAGWQDVSVTVERIGRKVFTADGMLDTLLGKVRTMLNTRGPEDYEKNERDLQSLILEAVKVGARHGGYQEAPRPDSSLKAVIIGCTITLLSAGAIGAWKLSNDSAAIRAEFTEWKQATLRWMEQSEKRLDRLENRR